MKQGVLICILFTFITGSAAAQNKSVGFLTGAGGLGDEAYSDLTYSGLRKAQQKYGFQLIVEMPDASGVASEAVTKKLIQQCDVLVLLGTQHSHMAEKYAVMHPDKIFINSDDALPLRPNIVSIMFKQNEGSYLAGALAGWMTRSKKIGFIGATDFDTIHAFRIGYLEGAAYAGPDIEVRQKFIAEGKNAEGFSKPKEAYKIAKQWFQDGVDIIYAVAGESGNGVIHAARESNKFAIGVDTDQDHMAKGHVLTSMMKRLDIAVFEEISRIMEDRLIPGVKYYGLKQGAVGLSPMKYTKHLIPETVRTQLETTKEKILTGEIQVTDYMRRSWSQKSGEKVGFLVGVGGLGDESYNDMTLAGIATAKKEFGFKLVHELSDATRKGIESAMEKLIQSKADIIVSNRIAYPDILYHYARNYPDRYFILHDMPWDGAANIASIKYAHNEGAFLAGALAGWMSQSRKIGFIGGTDLPIIQSFQIGFREGVKHAAPDAEILEQMVAGGQDAAGFDNPQKAYEIAASFYDQGADIIFVAAGLSGNGVIHAAKVKNKYVIGVDTDQDHMAKGRVLTSMMKRLDRASHMEIADIFKGRFHPGVKYYRVNEGGVGLSPMNYTRHLIPDTVMQKIETVRKQIASGEIQVTDFDYFKQGGQ